MSCNHPFFEHEEEMVKQTWLKPVIEKKYPNFDYFFYTSGNEDKIDFENHKIYCNTDDGFNDTFAKTQRAFEIIENSNQIEYDFILRTNLSTYFNIDLLSRVFVENFFSKVHNCLIGGLLVKNKNLVYINGAFLVLNKNHIKRIIDFNLNTLDNNIDFIDDFIIGKCLNKVNKYVMPIVTISKSPLYLNSDIENEKLDFIPAIVYRVNDFDKYDDDVKYKLRETYEFHLLEKLHNKLKNHKTTPNNVRDCLIFNNKFIFVNKEGLKPIEEVLSKK